MSQPPGLNFEEVTHLNRSTLFQKWHIVFGRIPSNPTRTEFIRQAIAWQTQAKLYGGIDAASLKTLKYGVSDEVLKGGTKLIREWRGVRHQVTVLTKGFEYAGTEYRSLSAIARKITGTPWNGLIFFGVKK